MTDLPTLIARLKELEAKASKGIWKEYERSPQSIFREYEIRCHQGALFRSTSYGKMREDAELIAETRNALPLLIEAVERLQKFKDGALSSGQYEVLLNNLKAKLEKCVEVLKFYAGHSKSDAKRLQVMDGGELARALLEELVK